jgi:small subunit ribosomal protein S16
VAVKIKLKRMGKIRAPYYRIVVADSRTKRDGRAIEEIGKYHPKADPSFIHVESERAQYWLKVGAQPTEPVRRILEITGDWQRFRGEPGAEGTLRTAEPKMTRSERFAEAVGSRPAGGETTPKRGGKGRTDSAKQETADKQDKAQAPKRKATPKADDAKTDTVKAETDTVKADTAKADAEVKTDTAKTDTAKADAEVKTDADKTSTEQTEAPAEAAASDSTASGTEA